MKTDNEIIAEFMGLKKDERGLWTGNLYKLTFDTNWNELMKVFSHIELLFFMGKSDVPYKTYITNEYVRIVPSDDSFQEWTFSCITGSKIQAAHKAVVAFIKSYNEQDTLKFLQKEQENADRLNQLGKLNREQIQYQGFKQIKLKPKDIMITKSELEKRIDEVKGKLNALLEKPFGSMTASQKENATLFKGEIGGLEYILAHWYTGLYADTVDPRTREEIETSTAYSSDKISTSSDIDKVK